MGPISTGLGEIYQYVIEVDSAHQKDYSLPTSEPFRTGLSNGSSRVFQAWSKWIPGVVTSKPIRSESGWSWKAQKLPTSPLSGFAAIEKQQCCRRRLFEKSNQAYFIRGEGLVSSLEDIEEIVVENRRYTHINKKCCQRWSGHATRFGAITGNGEGERYWVRSWCWRMPTPKQLLKL